MTGHKDPNYKAKWAKSPRARYTVHKAHAKSRGVEFTLTFEAWWALWEPHWAQRGKRVGDYCMARSDDKGGYTPGNVVVKPVEANLVEQLSSGAHVTRKLSRSDLKAIRALVNQISDAEIASRFGVSQPHVTRILNGVRGRLIGKEGV